MLASTHCRRSCVLCSTFWIFLPVGLVGVRDYVNCPFRRHVPESRIPILSRVCLSSSSSGCARMARLVRVASVSSPILPRSFVRCTLQRAPLSPPSPPPLSRTCGPSWPPQTFLLPPPPPSSCSLNSPLPPSRPIPPLSPRLLMPTKPGQPPCRGTPVR